MKLRTKIFTSVFAAAALVLGGVGAASAVTITSPGPLLEITISPDLNCDVRYQGDSEPSFYGATACATLVAAGGVLYGPEDIPAGGSAAPRTSWTPVSQNIVGTGTYADPFTATTVVTGGELNLTQVDTYVTGENSYRTQIAVTNTSGAAVDAVIYHAADCYLGDNDDGWGEHNASTGAITCRSDVPPNGRIEEFIPLTAGSNFLYAFYDEIWAAVGTQQPLPNEIRSPDAEIDNGIALSWTVNIPAAGTSTNSLLTNLSPIGAQPITTGLTVTPGSIFVGNQAAVVATVSNPNAVPQNLSSLVFTLPAGVSYVSGTTTGAGEPTVSGNTLTFSGPLNIPATGATTMNFSVRGDAVSGGTLNLSGSAEGGVPVLSSSATLEVLANQGPSVPVTPGEVRVVQAECPVPGEPTLPVVTIPANTEGLHYSLVGDVVQGGTVTVIATVQPGFVFADGIEGWELDSDRISAAKKITLDKIECEALVVPPKPTPEKSGPIAQTGSNLTNTALLAVSGMLLMVGGAVAMRLRKKA